MGFERASLSGLERKARCLALMMPPRLRCLLPLHKGRGVGVPCTHLLYTQSRAASPVSGSRKRRQVTDAIVPMRVRAMESTSRPVYHWEMISDVSSCIGST